MYPMLSRRAVAAAITVLGLVLAGSSVGAGAQSASSDPLAPAVVTGTIDTSGLTEEPGARTTTAGDLITQTRAGGAAGLHVKSSDTRLSGDLSIVYNEDERRDPVSSQFFAVQKGVYRIANAAGAWSGPMTGFSAGYDDQSNHPAVNMDSVTLEGEGAYDGLTAYLLVDWKDEPPSFQGAILLGEWPPEPSVL